MPNDYDDAVRELRNWAVTLLDKVEPMLDGVTDDDGHRCTGCPWCRTITALKQDQPDLLYQVAGQARAAVAFLRANIEPPVGGNPAGGGNPPAAETAPAADAIPADAAAPDREPPAGYEPRHLAD